LLLVTFRIDANKTASVTYDGTPMTKINEVTLYSGAGTNRLYTFGLKGIATTGAKAVVVSLSSSDAHNFAGGSISYTGVDQTSLPSITAGKKGNGVTEILEDITPTVDNSWVVAPIFFYSPDLDTKLTTNLSSFAVGTFFVNADTNGAVPASVFNFGITGVSADDGFISAIVIEPKGSPPAPPAPSGGILFGKHYPASGSDDIGTTTAGLLAAVGLVSTDTFSGIFPYLMLSAGVFVGFYVIQQIAMFFGKMSGEKAKIDPEQARWTGKGKMEHEYTEWKKKARSRKKRGLDIE
jgi:hypothetical protein